MKLILGNWKMNGDKAFIVELLQQILSATAVFNQVDIGVLPPYVFLAEVSELLHTSHIRWGAQNVSQFEQGAYTGEISISMLKDFACHYVLVGHSERRSLFAENNATIAAKFWRAQQAKITPVLCVGETLLEREEGVTEEVLAQQLAAVFANTDLQQATCPIIVAYEPVWAIGTGKTATPDMAQAVHQFIKKFLEKLGVMQTVKVLYGGSMNAGNAESLLAMPDIDGGLIGGASLKADDFIKIAEAANLS